MLSAGDYRALDAVALADLIRRREIKPREAVEAAIAAIERIDVKLNAVTLRMFEQGLAAADQPRSGPFAGVPFLLKDFLAQYEGVPTSAGSAFFARDFALADSELVVRYKRAGLAIVGKTNSSEFAISASSEPRVFGPTRNPWDLSRSAGGSSGGSAAAVAARLVPAAHATDGGGSIRIPASACGVFGLKPSRGRISMAPSGEGLGGAANEHVVSWSVRDSAALLDATAGMLAGDPYAAPPPARPYLQVIRERPQKLKIALGFPQPPGTVVEDNCFNAYVTTTRLLENLGHDLDYGGFQVDWQAIDQAFFTVMAVQTATVMQLRAGTRSFAAGDFEPLTWALAEAGRKFTGQDYLRAIQVFHRTGRAVAPFFEKYDLLLSPTLAELPPKLGVLDTATDDAEGFLRRTFQFAPFTKLFNITGQPAMSVPLYMADVGVPVGVQLAAPYGREDLLLQLAAQLEEARPWAHLIPSVALG